MTSNEIAQRVTQRFLDHAAEHNKWWGYQTDIMLDAMLERSRLLGDAAPGQHALEALERRNWGPDNVPSWRAQPFCHVQYAAWEWTGDDRWLAGFVAETRKWVREAGRSPEGALAHDDAGEKLLIDMLHDHLMRLCRCGALNGDTWFYDQALAEYERYVGLLFVPELGLWHTSRGWQADPMVPTPGAWSRGNGWMLRGLYHSLRALPNDHPASETFGRAFRALFSACVDRLDDDGHLHALPHLPHDRSHPDVTGTGMVAAFGFQGAADGFLPASALADAERAFQAMTQWVRGNGDIANEAMSAHETLDVCLVPEGRLSTGDHHAPATTLWACNARERLMARDDLDPEMRRVARDVFRD